MSSRSATPCSFFSCSRRDDMKSRQPSFAAKPFQTAMSPSFNRRPFSKHHSRISSSVPPCFTRQHIITMPRRLRKRTVYEEVARVLDIPGGEQIVKESYAQMRKFQLLEHFNCSAIRPLQREPH